MRIKIESDKSRFDTTICICLISAKLEFIILIIADLIQPNEK